jgi:hypothetical protein
MLRPPRVSILPCAAVLLALASGCYSGADASEDSSPSAGPTGGPQGDDGVPTGGSDGGSLGDDSGDDDSGGPGVEFEPAPVRLRLLLARHYRNAIRDLLGEPAAAPRPRRSTPRSTASRRSPPPRSRSATAASSSTRSPAGPSPPRR